MPSDNPFSEPERFGPNADHPAAARRTRPRRRPQRPAARRLRVSRLPRRPRFRGRTRRYGSVGRRCWRLLRPCCSCCHGCGNTLSQPDSGALRERAVSEVRRFEQVSRDSGIPIDQLRPAHYALCASLDDVVQATPWGSEGAWASRSLVSTFHQEVRSGDRFFDVLNQVKQNPGLFLPVLEPMYLCLSLGFQGRIVLSPRGPAELDRMREDVYGMIARQRPKADPELSPHWRGVTVPYRAARAELPVGVVGAAGSVVICGMYAWTLFGLNDGSDALYARTMAAPPAQTPVIVRGLPRCSRLRQHLLRPNQARWTSCAASCGQRSSKVWLPCSEPTRRPWCGSAIAACSLPAARPWRRNSTRCWNGSDRRSRRSTAPCR